MECHKDFSHGSGQVVMGWDDGPFLGDSFKGHEAIPWKMINILNL